MNDPIEEAQKAALKGDVKAVIAIHNKLSDEDDKFMVAQLYETALINKRK